MIDPTRLDTLPQFPGPGPNDGILSLTGLPSPAAEPQGEVGAYK